MASDTCPVCKLGTCPSIGRRPPQTVANSFGQQYLHHMAETGSARVRANVWHARNSDDGKWIRPTAVWGAPLVSTSTRRFLPDTQQTDQRRGTPVQTIEGRHKGSGWLPPWIQNRASAGYDRIQITSNHNPPARHAEIALNPQCLMSIPSPL
jgi:hypothetical protein